jgi:hypothetical protein
MAMSHPATSGVVSARAAAARSENIEFLDARSPCASLGYLHWGYGATGRHLHPFREFASFGAGHKLAERGVGDVTFSRDVENIKPTLFPPPPDCRRRSVQKLCDLGQRVRQGYPAINGRLQLTWTLFCHANILHCKLRTCKK